MRMPSWRPHVHGILRTEIEFLAPPRARPSLTTEVQGLFSFRQRLALRPPLCRRLDGIGQSPQRLSPVRDQAL